MNEQVARDVVLVRAIETVDQKREILSDDDRLYASRSAKELAQWQASEQRTVVTADHFLQQRSEQIIKRLGERRPAFAAFAKRRDGLSALAFVLPVVGLLLGAGVDRITDPHRIDLLSAPLLAIIAWNLLVYLLLLVALCLPSSKPAWTDGLLRRTARQVVPRKLGSTLTSALTQFLGEWTMLSYPLKRARLSRTIHLSAAMFALGAMLSLYARGLLSAYIVGWESTFLDAQQVQAILSVLFAPARLVFHLPDFSVEEIGTLRFGPGSTGAGAALWVHLYAATLLLLVVLPRLVLAAVAHWQARRRARNFPLDLTHAYFRQLGDQSLAGPPNVLRVLPYSFTLDEARQRGLETVAAMLLGEQTKLLLRPSSNYGDEPQETLDPTAFDDPSPVNTAVLFNLASTPEKENHGMFLDYLVRKSPRPVTALIDASALRERLGAQAGADDRLAARIALWQEFCRFHQVDATIVDLLHPATRAVA